MEPGFVFCGWGFGGGAEEPQRLACSSDVLDCRRVRRIAKPTPNTPTSIMAQVEGSGVLMTGARLPLYFLLFTWSSPVQVRPMTEPSMWPLIRLRIASGARMLPSIDAFATL